MITDQQKQNLIMEYEKVPKEQRPDFYLRLPELLGFQKLSPVEIAHRTQAWTEYYDTVRQQSPAAQLFEEWKLWSKGKGNYTKEQLQAMTKDMKEKGLPDIAGRPRYADPFELRNLMIHAESAARYIEKRDRKTQKKWEE